MRLLVLLLLLSPVRARGGDDWTWQDSAWEAGFAAAVLVDVRQTGWALQNGYREMNPLLGERPTAARLHTSALLAVAGHAAVSALLPPRYRRWWQMVSLAAEGSAVGHNLGAGVSVRF